MTELYPFLMAPHFEPRPWGAYDLAPLYERHVEPGGQPIGEVWLTADESKVANGPFAGRTLGDLCQRLGRELVGADAPEPNRFPLLVKFLFPRQKLSVQVHPDDETAHRCGQLCGKTECWYVVEAGPDAQIGLGLKPGVTVAEFRCAIDSVTAEQLLNWVEITAGDMILVDAGTVHTLGPNAIILETQQNSDTTYRLYDYGRPRPLHVTQGLAATREHTAAGKVQPLPARDGAVLISTGCFEVTRVRLEGSAYFVPSALEGQRSAQVLVALEGAGVVECPGHAPIMWKPGDAVVIPAALRGACVRPQWTVEFLSITLPLRAGQSPAES